MLKTDKHNYMELSLGPDMSITSLMKMFRDRYKDPVDCPVEEQHNFAFACMRLYIDFVEKYEAQQRLRG